MQSLQKQIQELCLLSSEVLKNPSQSPNYTAKKLGLSHATIKVADSGIFIIESLVYGPIIYGPIIGGVLYIWRKLTDSQRRKEEKERMLREVIAKQQVVIRKLESEEAKMKQENAQNRAEVENLKQMLHILEQVANQVKTAV